MKTVFVIKDSKSDFPLSVCWDEGTAKATVGNLNNIDSSHQYNYTEVPIHFEDGTEVKIIAPPIKKEYLPSSEKPPVVGSAYPPEFKHVEREWKTETHRHWIENFMDESTGDIISIERKELLDSQ